MQKLKFVKRDSFAPGFMVWAGVSFNNKGVKVNADYYIGHVLKPFIEKDVPRLFPGRAREMVFHQDSASSHTARKTLDFLQKRLVQYMTPSEWMPKSPDCAPMDYGIWGILNASVTFATVVVRFICLRFSLRFFRHRRRL